MRIRLVVSLNLASLLLCLLGAGLAASPVLLPFHGQELMDLTIDATYPQKTPAFEAWGKRNDGFGRWGLICVALGTIAGAIAQMADSKSKVRKA